MMLATGMLAITCRYAYYDVHSVATHHTIASRICLQFGERMTYVVLTKTELPHCTPVSS